MPRGQALPEKLDLSLLGATPQAAMRRLGDEFERRGWRDESGAALSVVRRLEGDGGSSSWQRAAKAVPSVFLSKNRVPRRDLEDALKAAAMRR